VGVKARDKGIKKEGVGKSGVRNGGKKRKGVIRGVRRKDSCKGVRIRGS